MHSTGPRTLAADRSVYALWPLAAGCHTIDYYYYYLFLSTFQPPYLYGNPLIWGESATELHLVKLLGLHGRRSPRWLETQFILRALASMFWWWHS